MSSLKTFFNFSLSKIVFLCLLCWFGYKLEKSTLLPSKKLNLQATATNICDLNNIITSELTNEGIELAKSFTRDIDSQIGFVGLSDANRQSRIKTTWKTGIGGDFK